MFSPLSTSPSLLVGNIGEPRVFQDLISRDPFPRIEVGHLADEVLEVGVEEVALPKSKRAPGVLFAKGVGHPAHVGRPGVPAAEVVHETVEVVPVGEVRDLPRQDVGRGINCTVAVDEEYDVA